MIVVRTIGLERFVVRNSVGIEIVDTVLIIGGLSLISMSSIVIGTRDECKSSLSLTIAWKLYVEFVS